MSVARRRRRYVRWARYLARLRRFDNAEPGQLTAITVPYGFARAQRHVVGRWMRRPGGWMPR